jgi:hypothetical protein
MSAPSKGCKFQRVRTPSTESLASSVEQIYAAKEAMNLSKPYRRMQQAATKVNVLSPVMINITKADAFHIVGRQHLRNRNWQECADFVGILGSGMLQDGKSINLGDPLCASRLQGVECQQTSLRGQGCWERVTEVGSVRSTRSAGKPCTRQQDSLLWGRDRRGKASENGLGIYATLRAE